MSSIMRSRSALPGRCEGSEVIGGSSLELKVAGPSMLGIGCPDRHALPLTHAPPSPKIYRPRRASSRESGFVLCPVPAVGGVQSESPARCRVRSIVLEVRCLISQQETRPRTSASGAVVWVVKGATIERQEAASDTAV